MNEAMIHQTSVCLKCKIALDEDNTCSCDSCSRKYCRDHVHTLADGKFGGDCCYDLCATTGQPHHRASLTMCYRVEAHRGERTPHSIGHIHTCAVCHEKMCTSCMVLLENDLTACRGCAGTCHESGMYLPKDELELCPCCHPPRTISRTLLHTCTRPECGKQCCSANAAIVGDIVLCDQHAIRCGISGKLCVDSEVFVDPNGHIQMHEYGVPSQITGKQYCIDCEKCFVPCPGCALRCDPQTEMCECRDCHVTYCANCNSQGVCRFCTSAEIVRDLRQVGIWRERVANASGLPRDAMARLLTGLDNVNKKFTIRSAETLRHVIVRVIHQPKNGFMDRLTWKPPARSFLLLFPNEEGTLNFQYFDLE